MRVRHSDVDAFLLKNFKAWLLAKWKVTTGEHRGERYSFEYAPFMEGLCEDTFKEIVVMKCAQSTFSEFFVARMIWRALTQKKNFLYTFPAGAQLKDFVETRIRAPLQDNSELKKYITGPCNLALIGLNNNELHFRGVTQRRQIISVPVSEIYCDEIDEYPSPQRTIYTIEKRMGMASDPRKYLFSTPKYPGEGISRYYYGDTEEPGSDQREWIVECRDCHTNQMLEHERNIIDRNKEKYGTKEYFPDCYLGCWKCGVALDVRGGRWEPQNKALSKYRHGYHVSRMMMPHANINALAVDMMDPMKTQEFYNSELGLPKRPRGEALSEVLLKEMISDYSMFDKYNYGSFIGVDQGKKFHVVVIDQNLRILHVDELDYTEDWREISVIMHKFRAISAVCDANPNIVHSRNFAEIHSGKVKLSIYPHISDVSRGRDIFAYSTKDQRIVHVDRERAMEYVTHLLLSRIPKFPANVLIRVPDFFEQLKAPIRAVVQDSTGNEVVKYLKQSKADHYFHALLYAIVAMKIGSMGVGIIHNVFTGQRNYAAKR